MRPPADRAVDFPATPAPTYTYNPSALTVTADVYVRPSSAGYNVVVIQKELDHELDS